MKKSLTSLCLLLLFFFSLTSVATALDWNITYNLSSLPISGSAQFNFTLQPNATMTLSLSQNDTRSQLFYPSTSFFANSSNLTLEINYTIPFFLNYTGNETLIMDRFNISNDVNTNILPLSLNYKILHPSLANQTNGTYMLVSDSGKSVEIHTFSAVEFNATHHVTVRSLENETVYISCGQFLTCPSNLIVNASNQTEFDALIYIPRNQTAGNYTSNISLSVRNTTASIDFTILISGDDIYQLILYDIENQDCFSSPEAYVDCWRQRAQYDAEIYNRLVERFESGNITDGFFCGNYTVVNETVRYVEVGNVDPILFADYEKLREQYNTLSGDYMVLSTSHKSCLESKDTLQNKVSQETARLSDEYILKRNELQVSAQEDKVAERTRLRKLLGNTLLFLIFVLLCIMFFSMWATSRWNDSFRIPPKLMVGLITFLSLAWLVIVIFLR